MQLKFCVKCLEIGWLMNTNKYTFVIKIMLLRGRSRIADHKREVAWF